MGGGDLGGTLSYFRATLLNCSLSLTVLHIKDCELVLMWPEQ